MKKLKRLGLLALSIVLFMVYFFIENKTEVISFIDSLGHEEVIEIPSNLTYDGRQEVTVLDNQPHFSPEELNLDNGVWQTLSELDHLNRVGQANALIGKESFPTEEREPLNVKPTGWRQKKLSTGEWLYNRCHLIGFQLTGENDNPRNLMTGTRSFNTPFMLNYENQIKSYIQKTGNHVRYRVTPHFNANELVARGIQLEAQSIETDELAFNVFIFNVQEGYEIDYQTGQSKAAGKGDNNL